MLVHLNYDMTGNAAKGLVISLIQGGFGPCTAWILGMVKQKTFTKSILFAPASKYGKNNFCVYLSIQTGSR